MSSQSALGQEFAQLGLQCRECPASMAVLFLLRQGHFGKGQFSAIDFEDRVVAEALFASRCPGDLALATPFHLQQHAAIGGGDAERRAEVGLALA